MCNQRVELLSYYRISERYVFSYLYFEEEEGDDDNDRNDNEHEDEDDDDDEEKEEEDEDEEEEEEEEKEKKMITFVKCIDVRRDESNRCILSSHRMFNPWSFVHVAY